MINFRALIKEALVSFKDFFFEEIVVAGNEAFSQLKQLRTTCGRLFSSFFPWFWFKPELWASTFRKFCNCHASNWSTVSFSDAWLSFHLRIPRKFQFYYQNANFVRQLQFHFRYLKLKSVSHLLIGSFNKIFALIDRWICLPKFFLKHILMFHVPIFNLPIDSKFETFIVFWVT